MADEKRIEGVYTIRVEQGPALRALEQINRQLDTNKVSLKEKNKELREAIKEEQALEKAIKASGVATEEESKKLAAARARVEELTRATTELNVVNRGLSGQARELSNDLSGLTEQGLRFRDKMAQATREALEGSTVFQQLSARTEHLTSEIKESNVALEQQTTEIDQLKAAFKRGEITEQEYTAKLIMLNDALGKSKQEHNALELELEQVRVKSDALEKEIEQLNAEFRQGKIDQKEYREGLARIEVETRKAGDATGHLTGRFDAFVSNQGKELRSTLSSLALNYVGVGAAIYGVQKILGSAIDTVVEFDKAIARIRALPGFAEDIDALGEAARTVGVDLGIGAVEAAGAIEALAKAGLTTEQILNGGLRGALEFAAAGELDVAAAAETAASALTQFKLQGEDVSRVADALVAGSDAAQGSVDSLRQALNQSGLVASQLGLDLEDTVGTLTLFAKAGLIGSDAGTSFRTMLLRLQNPTEESASLMKQLGIDAFDLEGRFVGIESLAGQLQDRLGGLTQEQRSQTLAQLFGSDAIRAANVLYAEGAKGVDKYTKVVSDAGAAQRKAAEQTNNLSGDLDRANAAWEAFVLDLENGNGVISQGFRSLTQQFTSFLNVLSGNASTFDRIRGGLGSAVSQENLDKIKAATDKIDELRAAAEKAADIRANPWKLSLEEMQARLDELRRVRDEFAKSGKTQAAAEGDAEIKSWERIIAAVNRTAAAKRKQAAASGALSAEQEKQVAAIKAEEESLKGLKKRLEELKGARTASNDNAEEIAEVEAKIRAIEGEKKSRTSAAKQAKEDAEAVEGSVANLEKKLADLRTEQSRSTTSAQFATYQQQIEALQEEVDLLTGKLKALADIPAPVFGEVDQSAPIPAAPTAPNLDEIAALGINPNAPEAAGKTLKELEAMAEEFRVEQLRQSENLNDQLAALDADWNAGRITSLLDYQTQRAEINEQIAENERARVQNDIALAEQGLQQVQSIIDQGFDSRIRSVDEENAALQEKLKSATDDQEKQRIEDQIKANEADKKALEERKENAKAFGVIAALIATYQSANQAFLSQLVPGDPTSLPRAIAAAVLATAAGLLNVAKLQGLAKGGEVEGEAPSGTVTSLWGTNVHRSNGDNVLVRTRKGYVTLRTGEKVLNERQQQRLEGIAGPGVWGAIGLPGHTDSGAIMSHFRRSAYESGYNDGGVVGLVTPTPSVATMAQAQLNGNIAALTDRKMYVSWKEGRDVGDRVEFNEGYATL